MREKVCMVIPSFSAKGGITAVANGYRDSKLEKDYDVKYIETYCDAGKAAVIAKAFLAYIKFFFLVIFWRPAIVHIHSSFGGSFYRKLPFILIAHCFRRPIVNHIHGADFGVFYRNAGTKKKRLVRNTYEKCDVIVALSDEWREKLQEVVSQKKIRVIENYSVLNHKAIEERSQKKNTHTILFLGFICDRKGCYDVPDIVEKVIVDIPDAKFILAGSGEIDAVKAKCSDSVKVHIEFPGWIRGSEKDRLLREADVFFLPSYNEGMPMSILDAMGYGLPIVSTTVGGITKIVHDGKNGFVFEPADKNGMAEAIVKILSDENMLKTMGQSSVKIIEDGYSLEKHIENLEGTYRDVCR